MCVYVCALKHTVQHTHTHTPTHTNNEQALCLLRFNSMCTCMSSHYITLPHQVIIVHSPSTDKQDCSTVVISSQKWSDVEVIVQTNCLYRQFSCRGYQVIM